MLSLNFPVIHARNLEGKTYHLPGDFEGAYNVAIIPFRRWQQGMVDSWVPRLEHMMQQFPTLRIYELPTIPGSYTWMRPFIDGAMKYAIPSSEVRQRTLTVYTDVEHVRVSLHIDDMETISLFLVDPKGTIFWRSAGAYDEQQADELEQRVASFEH
jgi:hypothetical protein